jgi:hypothetical protein
MSWIEKLQNRWKLSSKMQVFWVLLTFACTGFTVLFLKKPVLALLGLENLNAWQKALYWVFILPVYQIILLFYGWVFGQFHFFWAFEKKMIARMFGKKTKDS